jgi:hypothetical protein
VKTRYGAPSDGHWADGAGDQLNLDPHTVEFGQQDVEFSIADQGFPAHDGEVNGTVATHQCQHTVYQSFTVEVHQLAKRNSAS